MKINKVRIKRRSLPGILPGSDRHFLGMSLNYYNPHTCNPHSTATAFIF
jgi:hypothetical protein